MSDLLTIEEVMTTLRLSRKQVKAMVNRGELNVLKITPRAWRFREQDINSILTGGDSEKVTQLNGRQEHVQGELST